MMYPVPLRPFEARDSSSCSFVVRTTATDELWDKEHRSLHEAKDWVVVPSVTSHICGLKSHDADMEIEELLVGGRQIHS
jgi:hypothetical protein